MGQGEYVFEAMEETKGELAALLGSITQTTSP